MFEMMQEMARQAVKSKLQKMIRDVLLNPESLAGLMSLLKFSGIDINQLTGLVSQGSFDPYVIMNLDRSASDEQVKARYRELAKLLHPDTSGTANTGPLFQAVQVAYERIGAERGWK